MKSLTGVLIARGQDWKVFAALVAVSFLLLLAMMAAFGTYQIRGSLLGYGDAGLEQYARIRQSLTRTLDTLGSDVTAQPCSEDYYRQLRRVAYLPDGISEFIYAPEGLVHCALSSGGLATPYDLGVPDLHMSEGVDVRLWFNHDLAFLGLEGLTGNIVSRSGLAVVVPQQASFVATPPWVSSEAVVRNRDGQWWHQAGEAGVYARHSAMTGPWQLNGDTFFHQRCDEFGLYCVVTEARIGNLLAFSGPTVVGAILLCAILSYWLSTLALRLLQSYFGFEARFRRQLTDENIICHYQPIMDVRSGVIVGCEVLVRWRDFDGSMIYPDRFLPIVERQGLTLALTRLVIAKAHAELGAHPEASRPLQVNFNIFPMDFQASKLIALFDIFTREPIGVEIAVEIIETDDLDVDMAQTSIAVLADAGIRTYLDDFGSGYSSIHRLAELSLEGVKLDRAFAMAPDGTLMAQMLPHALDMMQRGHRATVVEGVESRERLVALRDSGLVDFVQGYYIARPLEIERFMTFLRDSSRHTLPAQMALLPAPDMAAAG